MGNLHLIGENFGSFISNNCEQAVGINEFLTHIDKFLSIDCIYKIGQGLSDIEIEKLRIIKNKYPNLQIHLLNDRENKYFVHKVYDKNVMITKPIRLREDIFKSNLLLDDDCAEMSDHVTGQHIQGTVIIEAARQMMLSVTENYFVDFELKNKVWFILNKISINFFSFLFPIEIEIIYKVDIFRSSGHRRKFIADMVFYQGKKEGARIEISYCVYDKEFLTAKEAQLAKEKIS